MEPIEREILRGIQSGDQRAFSMLLRLYFHSLTLFAGSIINNPETAKDIVQEVFLKLWNNRGSFEIKSSLKSYLYKTVHNFCIDHLRKELRSKVKTVSYDDLSFRLEVFEIKDSDPLFEFFFSEEMETALQKAIDQLPVQCRQIFTLNRFEQLSYAEISERLNISLSTVKTQMIRAMHKIKESIKEFL
jgi:RNA polymerase sigma-70 factor, ECF subfamily